MRACLRLRPPARNLAAHRKRLRAGGGQRGRGGSAAADHRPERGVRGPAGYRAAATSSLPETPGGERNYDYRYTWLRDSAFMLSGLYTLGLDREADDFFYFLADLAEEEA